MAHLATIGFGTKALVTGGFGSSGAVGGGGGGGGSSADHGSLVNVGFGGQALVTIGFGGRGVTTTPPPAWTLLAVTDAPGNYPMPPVGALLSADLADVTNGNAFVSTGHDLVIAHNTGGAPATITLFSVVDPLNRTGDITLESIPAGACRIYGPFPVDGWRQHDGFIYVEASSDLVTLAVIRLP